MKPCQWRRGCTAQGACAVSLKLAKATFLCGPHYLELLDLVDLAPIPVLEDALAANERRAKVGR